MSVLVDTSIWSLALRRTSKKQTRKQALVVDELRGLIDERRAVVCGPVRQEVLSGIADKRQFDRLKELMRPFEDLPIHTKTYELAAEFFNQCRKHGVQGSHIDLLICATAKQNRASVFSTDRDFERYAGHCGLELHKCRKEH